MALLRGLKASGPASSLRSSFSSEVRLLGSLLTWKLCLASSRAGLRVGRKRSGDLREPAAFVLESVLNVFKSGRRNEEQQEPLLRMGRVDAVRHFLAHLGSSDGPSRP